VAAPRAVAAAGDRPEVLFVCRSGFEAEALVALLKSAGCLVTHAQTKIEAMQRLARPGFEAMIVDCSVSGSYELQAQAELRGIPVLVIARPRNETTGTEIATGSVEKLLAALCAIFPSASIKARKRAIAS
jgi:CheY-like chemotaxis protein